MIGANDGSFGDDLEKDIGLLLREQRRQEADDLERELNLCRSGSAPPTVEGSLSAVGGLFGGSSAFSEFLSGKNGNGFVSEEELRSDPAYSSYYYNNVNLNPRLPPPLLSKEDWRFAQRLNSGGSNIGGIGDRRKLGKPDNGSGGSLFSMPPGFDSRKQESDVELDKIRGSNEWGADGLIGLGGLGLGSKQKSLAEIFQDDMGRSSPVRGHPSRPSSRNAFGENVDSVGSAEAELAHLRGSSAVQTIGPTSSYSYAAVVGSSLSRSTTPDPQLVARAISPCPTPIGQGRPSASEKRGANGSKSFNSESTDLAAALSGMNLSTNGVEENRHDANLFGIQGQNHMNQNALKKKAESRHLHMPSAQSPNLSGNSYMKGSPTSAFNSGGGLPSQYHHLGSPNSSLPNYGLSGYSANPALNSMMANQLGSGSLPMLYENVAASGLDSRVLSGGLGSGTNLTEAHNFGGAASPVAGSGLQAPFVDPLYLQYPGSPDYAALNDPMMDRNYLGSSYMNLLELQKAYVGALLQSQKPQYGKSGGSNHHGYYGSPGFAGMPYPGSPLASPAMANSPVGPGSPMRHLDLNMRYPSGMRNSGGGLMGPWHLDAGPNLDGSFASSLLEEFKGNKTKSLELSEIAGHVVEFSADQYGSRFIQQKLETATNDEKTMVYQEIMPQALALMTDVFGNYVVQKFFEHGLPSQKRELGSKLFSHVLTLSLQMYGCRVIQKAIEVVDLDQKIKMVEELDGHVMRCVRDQNGNHVIQKCIECVPEENIQFIVSTFFGQVVSLSTHPYGCRVIQRILEHCKDQETQSKVMDEILGAISMLAQDQYGNYVVQHVLEHGKPHERSAIIKELAGNIVQMSQQKFASNVVEKCLTFGGPAERELLVNEMLGTTDENEPLQAMMKDQFANYVVQKVLETCDDQQREYILTRIKVHLNALKKYTYGKHIVARVEKLVAAGERRIASQSMQAA